MVATVPVSTRTFVPKDLNIADWAQIEPLFKMLLDRPLDTGPHIEKWLIDVSELYSVLDEYYSRRYIDKSCHTDDKAIEQAYLHYVEEIEPKTKPLFFQMQKKLLAAASLGVLTDRKYQILIRQWKADVELYRDENVAIETDVTKVVNEYDKICGAMTVEFRGKEYTLQQLARFTEQPDRATREEAWRVSTKRRLENRDQIEDIFEKLLPLRGKIAANAGMSDFRAYMWKALKRFDYTPDDCLKFADSIAHTVVPLVDELDKQRAADLKLPKLRPWDLAVDPLNRAPLTPFPEADIDGFVAKTRTIFDRLSPELASDFDSLSRHKNLDLGSRKGKQPGGYQSTLNEVREPFIFMNAAGLQRDVDTLLHEGGHAFHALAARDEPLVFLRSAPMEFCEVASMAMELFGIEHLDVFYNPADHARAKRVHLEGIIRFFPWMATIDSFQHWLYTNPSHSREARKEEWLRLSEKFGSKLDWTGLEDAREVFWQRQLHLFHVPFYYVEYGIAQLGALQLWMKAKEDPQKALNNYRAGLKLGGTRPLPELFSAAGIRFDFSEKTLRPLISAIGEELSQLPH